MTRAKQIHLQTDECSSSCIKSNVGPSMSFLELKSYLFIKKSETCLMVISFRIYACCTHPSRPCEIATGRCANTASGAIHQAINSFLRLHLQLKAIRMSSGSSPEHSSQKATDNRFWRTCPLAHHQITVAACYGHGLRATPRYC